MLSDKISDGLKKAMVDRYRRELIHLALRITSDKLSHVNLEKELIRVQTIYDYWWELSHD